MILIDDRTGSKHLAPMLKARGVPTKMARLKAGDVAGGFTGSTGFKHSKKGYAQWKELQNA